VDAGRHLRAPGTGPARAHKELPVLLVVAEGLVAGGVLGSRLAGHVPDRVLRKGFGWFVVVMGAFVLGQQLPAAWWPVVGAVALHARAQQRKAVRVATRLR
jgi:hypothetical protein